MFVREIITEGITTLKVDDTCAMALRCMEEMNVSHLPIVDDGRYLGVISDLVASVSSPQLPMRKLNLGGSAFVRDYQTIFEVMRVMNEYSLTVVPVLDDLERYVGAITMNSMMTCLSQSMSAAEPGSVLVVELNANDYMLSEMARIVEDNDTKILSLVMQTSPDSMQIRVFIKLNKIEIDPIIKTFERYGYNVISSLYERDDWEEIRDRYNEFMNYLNI